MIGNLPVNGGMGWSRQDRSGIRRAPIFFFVQDYVCCCCGHIGVGFSPFARLMMREAPDIRSAVLRLTARLTAERGPALRGRGRERGTKVRVQGWAESIKSPLKHKRRPAAAEPLRRRIKADPAGRGWHPAGASVELRRRRRLRPNARNRLIGISRGPRKRRRRIAGRRAEPPKGGVVFTGWKFQRAGGFYFWLTCRGQWERCPGSSVASN